MLKEKLAFQILTRCQHNFKLFSMKFSQQPTETNFKSKQAISIKAMQTCNMHSNERTSRQAAAIFANKIQSSRRYLLLSDKKFSKKWDFTRVDLARSVKRSHTMHGMSFFVFSPVQKIQFSISILKLIGFTFISKKGNNFYYSDNVKSKSAPTAKCDFFPLRAMKIADIMFLLNVNSFAI